MTKRKTWGMKRSEAIIAHIEKCGWRRIPRAERGPRIDAMWQPARGAELSVPLTTREVLMFLHDTDENRKEGEHEDGE